MGRCGRRPRGLRAPLVASENKLWTFGAAQMCHSTSDSPSLSLLLSSFPPLSMRCFEWAKGDKENPPVDPTSCISPLKNKFPLEIEEEDRVSPIHFCNGHMLLQFGRGKKLTRSSLRKCRMGWLTVASEWVMSVGESSLNFKGPFYFRSGNLGRSLRRSKGAKHLQSNCSK